VSVGPPAANGTTMVIGLVGYSAAWLAAPKATVSAASELNRMRVIMIVVSLERQPGYRRLRAGVPEPPLCPALDAACQSRP
jgi:hypothetical protein